MPLVSIIVNVCNGSSTLQQTLASALAQTFQDWEMIVWDDCSTDDSASIVAQYQDRRIRYFLSSEDTSLSRARLMAIQQAHGDWIAFLDQDDIWLPQKLERQVSLIGTNVGLIYGRTIRFYPNGKERDYDQAHEFQLLPEGDIFSQLFRHSCFIAMSSAVFRRSAIEHIGGIPDAIQIIPDYWLYVAVARQFQVRAVQTPVCRYRMHSGNMSRLTALKMHREVLWLIEQWANRLDPSIVALCCQRHFTAIAMEELKSSGSFRHGVADLIQRGSLASVLARPLTFALHVVRRNIRVPYWRLLDNHDGLSDQS